MFLIVVLNRVIDSKGNRRRLTFVVIVNLSSYIKIQIMFGLKERINDRCVLQLAVKVRLINGLPSELLS